MTGLDQTIADRRAGRADATSEPKDIDEVLLSLQAELPVLAKDKKGQVGNQKTKYADLVQVNEVVLKRLNAMGAIWTCRPHLEAGSFGLHYSLKHVPSGTEIVGVWPLKLSENPQQMGSATTYGRRYSLLAVTGIVAEDEDDDGASSEQPSAQRQTRVQQRQRPPTGGTGQPTAQRATRARPVDGPPLPGEEPPTTEPAPRRTDVRKATGPMLQKLAILFGEIGVTERTERLALTSTLAGRPLESGSDLDFQEGRKLIDRLERAKLQPDPLGWLATVDDDTPEGDPS